MTAMTRTTRRRGAVVAMSRLTVSVAALAILAYAVGCSVSEWVLWSIVAVWAALVPFPVIAALVVRQVRLIRSVDVAQIRATRSTPAAGGDRWTI